MLHSEVKRLFIHSRTKGLDGARRRCTKRTIEAYERNLDFFIAWLKGRGVIRYTDISKADILEFVDAIEGKGWSRATQLQMLRVLRTLFRWIDRDEDCREAGCKNFSRALPVIEKAPNRMFIPSIEELRKFKDGFNTTSRWGFRDYVVAILLLETGMRVGEVCNLKIGDVMFEEKMLIADGKTGKRMIPLTDAVSKLLKMWLKTRQRCGTAKHSQALFVTKYADHCVPNTFGQVFRKQTEKLGLPDITPHTLRHAFCTYYLRGGGDIAKLRTVTGHTNFNILNDYINLAKVGSKQMQVELEKVSPLKQIEAGE